MRYFKAKTTESAGQNAKRRSGQDAAPLAADDQAQCSAAAGAAGTARWQQEQAKDPYRRKRTPMWKRPSKSAPQPARPAEPLDAANAPAAGDVEATKPYKPQSSTSTAGSETLLEPEEVEIADKEQQTSCTAVPEDGTVLAEYGVAECRAGLASARPSPRPSATSRQPVPGLSRPADDEDDDETDSDESATDVAVGGVPSTASASTSVPEAAATDRLSAELKALVSLVETSTGSPVRCVSATRTATTSASREGAATAATEAKGEATEGDGEGLRTWQRNFLGRLTRARQRRDIRLNRKEVLSMQLVLETVLKQHMALSREVEAVKANMQWGEGLEPVSLSRALSRLQAERNEEAAALDKILACKDQEVRGLQAQLEQARVAAAAHKKQAAVLEQSCREKDVDLEKAALALATVHTMHRKWVQDADRRRQEQVEALQAAHAAAEAKAAERHQADLASQLQELRLSLRAELGAEAARREAELQARMSTLRTDAAAKESRLEMESLRLSRANKEHEEHLGRLMETVNQLQTRLRDQEASARTSLAQAQAELQAELQRVRAEREDDALLVGKALNACEGDAQHLRDAAEAARQALECQLQALRQDADHQMLEYGHALNQKDHQLNSLMIETEGLRAALAEAEARLAQAEDANASLLKTAEAMNARQADLSRELHHNFGQLEQYRGLLGRKEQDVAELQRANEDIAAELERHRRALQEQQGVVDERDRLRAALSDLHASTDAELCRLRQELRDRQHDGEEAARLQRAFDKLRKTSAAAAEELRKEMQALHDGHVSELTRLHDGHAVELMRLQTALQEAKAKRKAEAEHFRKALHEKDVQIRDIQDQFEKFRLDQDEEQARLTARSAGLDKEVSVLKNAVSQMKSAHKERVAGLEKKASDLAEQVRRLKQDADQARGEQREVQQRAREADRARVQAEQALVRQRQADQDREGQLSDLQRQRDELLADRDGLQLEVEHLAKQKENCQVVLDEREREVRALRDTIEKLESRAARDAEEEGGLLELRGELQERAEEAARLRAELGAAIEQREAVMAKVSKLFKVVRRSFDRRTSEKASLELELQAARDQLDSAVQSHQAEQDKMMKMMLGKENDMKQLRENLHQYEDHLRSTKEEMDATNSLLKRNIVELEREARRRDADLRQRDAELTRLQAAQDEVARLQVSEQQTLQRASQLEASLEESKRRAGELELELEVGRTLLKKNAEECRLKTEKLQQSVEHVRAERDSELTVLKDAVTRLQAELLERDRQLEHVKVDTSIQLQGLQQVLGSRQDETERLTDEAERLHRENEALRAKEAELRESIAYLEGGEAEAVLERDERIAALQEEQRRMAEAMEEALRRDERDQLQVAEALQEAARVKEVEMAALRDEQRRQAADAAEALRRKDEQIAALEESVENLRTGLDLDLLRLRDQLSEAEQERQQLTVQASVLEGQLKDQIAFMAKQIADKDEEVRALTEDRVGIAARAERENADLSEENAQLLAIMQRMKQERKEDREARRALEAEMKEAIRTTNGALRAKEDRLETLREEAAEAAELRCRLAEAERAAAEADELRATLSRQQQEQVFLREQLDAARRVAYEAGRKAAETEAEIARELQQGDAGPLEGQLRSRQAEVDKLRQTVEALRADLGFQKQLLLTFHEGRSYLGALSVHDRLAKGGEGLWDPRNTEELTALRQDGDHRPAPRLYRRPQYELKRVLSEGDTKDVLDLNLLCSESTSSELTVSSISSDLLPTMPATMPPQQHVRL